MKIKMLEVYKNAGQVYEKDDLRTVPDDVGAMMCKYGFAEDAAGSVATGTRPKEGDVVVLQIHNGVISS